ncbi:hypothetical protein [Actinomadura terrae]|uniref:hypothetical protein n=1 Tax=Actinomadura terrae TaxID=604353 RepID=UPI001FA762DD|nr:hypothetical protein [Actinomadura terrae]
MTFVFTTGRAPAGAAACAALAASALLTACDGNGGGAPHREGPATVTRLEFTETSYSGGEGREGAVTTVRIWVSLRGRQAMTIHSLTSRPGGVKVYESRWDRSLPQAFAVRDWATCEEGVEDPPEPRLDTLDALLDDVLGPPARPSGARPVKGRPNAWETVRGLRTLRIVQHGAAYSDREVLTFNESGRLVGRISSVGVAQDARMPGWAAGWTRCAPSVTG